MSFGKYHIEVMLSNTDILHLAALANLDLTSAEIEKLKGDLSIVIEHFADLKNLNTDNLMPTSQTTGLINVTRQDEVNPDSILPVSSATSGTDTHNDYFVVSALLDKDAI